MMTHSSSPKRVGEILIQHGKINKKQLTAALNFQHFERVRDNNCQIGEFLISHRCIERNDLEEALRAQGQEKHKSSHILEKTVRVTSVKNKELFEFVPKNIAETYGIFPVALKEDKVKKTLFLAIDNINDQHRLQVIQFQLGCFVSPLHSTKKNIRKSIETYYPKQSN